MRKLMVMLSVLLLSACASTGVFDAATGEDAVTLKVVNQLDKGEPEVDSPQGWQMPGMNQMAKVGILTVDGDQLEVGADNTNVSIEPGKHVLKLFADDGGMLRFGKLKYNFASGATYDIIIGKIEGGANDYRAQLVDPADSEKVLKEVAF